MREYTNHTNLKINFESSLLLVIFSNCFCDCGYESGEGEKCCYDTMEHTGAPLGRSLARLVMTQRATLVRNKVMVNI